MPSAFEPWRRARRAVACALVAGLAAAAAGCDSGGSGRGPGLPARSYRMGFMGIPPGPDTALAIAAIQMWTARSDAAVHHVEPPWTALLAGAPPDSLVRAELVPLLSYYRALGLELVVSLDVTNGLDRSSDAAPLVAAGRSLTEPAVRQLARAYAVAVDTIVRPARLLVASEVNLVRLAAAPALYQAVKQLAGDCAADVRAVDATVPIGFTVQVETAWGRLGGSGAYAGIATDLADFAFADFVGLSSYPYFGWVHPDSLPLDYYARLVAGTSLRVLVVEGGWTSVSGPGVTSSPAVQAAYVRRHAQILDAARATHWFQLTFTDLDTTFFPPGTILPLFANNGLVTVTLAPKPALAEWDAQWERPRSH